MRTFTMKNYYNQEPIENRAIVKEEQKGYGRQFMVKHRTYIKSPDLRRSIARMSVEHIIT